MFFFFQCDEEVWDKIFDINVKAAYLLAKEAVPLIRQRGGGSIVFVSSIAGFQPFKVSFGKNVINAYYNFFFYFSSSVHTQ